MTGVTVKDHEFRQTQYLTWMIPYVWMSIKRAPVDAHDQLDAAMRDGRYSVRLYEVDGVEWCEAVVDDVVLCRVEPKDLKPPPWGQW